MNAVFNRINQGYWAPLLLIPFSSMAYADAIIPYMVVPWGQVFLLPLVIFVEAIVLQRLLGGTARSNFYQSFVSNLISTVLGVVLYFATMPMVGEGLFYWWFKGDFSTESFRNACIALMFTVVLWLVSWLSEAAVIERMRNDGSAGHIRSASAVANLVTYAMLFLIAVWFGRAPSERNVDAFIDSGRNSQNIASHLKLAPEYPFVGFWKGACTDDFGSAIEAAGGGKYTVAFCGPGGCDRVERLTAVVLENNPNYRIIDQNTIETTSPGGRKLYRCATQEAH